MRLEHSDRGRGAGAVLASVAAGVVLLALFAALLVRSEAEVIRPTTWAVLIAGFLAVGWIMYLVLRRPVVEARSAAQTLRRRLDELDRGTLEMFSVLSATVEAKDRHTAGHGLRVTMTSTLIGEELGLNKHELELLRRTSTFHDIGKLAVPDAVLQATDELTPQQEQHLREHPAAGAQICLRSAALRDAAPAIRHHHEAFDGSGYPDGLSGTAIPLHSRIIAVADRWDILTTDQHGGRRGMPPEEALRELKSRAGTELDPEIVRAMTMVLRRNAQMFGLTKAQVDAT